MNKLGIFSQLNRLFGSLSLMSSRNMSSLITQSSSNSSRNLLLSNSMLMATKPTNGKLLNECQVPLMNQVRNWGYSDRMTLKDIKRRELLRKFAPERIRLQCLRKNSVLPNAFKRSTSEHLQKYPRQSALLTITNRCAFTSKPGGLMHRWRLSRHVWRDQADYNQLSGVMRASWGTPSYNAVTFRFKRFNRNWFNYDGYKTIHSILDSKAKSRTYRIKLY